MTGHEELIHRFLEDPTSLSESDLEQLIAHLRAEPAKAVELRGQLMVDDLLGQKLAVDRKNFIIMVQQRLADFERGEEEAYNQVADLRAIAEAEIEKSVRPPGISHWIKFAGGLSLVAVAVLCVVIWRYQESAPRAVANITELSGQVVRVHGAAEEPLRMGQAISTGESIVAAPGSSVVWEYKDGTTIRILGDTQAELSADSATFAKQVKLERGELSAKVAKQTRGPMTFATPHATATVRGTQFRLVVDAANTQLDVSEGKVDFQRNDGSQVLQLAANESGVATATNIQPWKVTWPVNRSSTACLYDGDAWLARNPETGNQRETPLATHSAEAGQDVLLLVKRSGEFSCDIVFTPEKSSSPNPAVICSLGPNGGENFLLLQTGKDLSIHFRAGSGTLPSVIELGEIALGSRHYLSFACKDGKAVAIFDGVEVISNDEFVASIPSWQEGPLVLEADAVGQRPWRGEVAALAIFDQFVEKALADANRQRFKQLNP
jgi:hypothetical protein